MKSSETLFAALRDPASLASLGTAEWNALIRTALAESLLGTVGVRSAGIDIPARARLLLDEAAAAAVLNHNAARYEVIRMAEALRPTGIPVILMKGSAYLMANLPPLPGRNIGDLDIMVPEAALGDAEAALKTHGWTSVKAKGGYDDQYYRDYMHELPPLAHGTRGGVIDLHHNILPRTARLLPQPERMFEHAVQVDEGVMVMGPTDMLLHSATHCAYDGDFMGGARNLWDIDRLVRHFAQMPGFWADLRAAAGAQQLSEPLRRALRLSRELYNTPLSADGFDPGKGDIVERLALRKLHGRGSYGELTVPLSEFALFVRGHWLRMPPLMLAKHLITKWRVRRVEAREPVPTRT
ncbi:MAG: nucleotidyltransferase family protein [Pacificimonas sp.]